MNASRLQTQGPMLWFAVAILAVAAYATTDDGAKVPEVARTPAEAFERLVEGERRAVTEQVEAAIVELARFPRVLVRAIVEPAAAPDRSEAEARACLAYLDRLGAADELPIILTLVRPGLEDVAQAAVLAVARRDSRTLPVLDGLARRAPTDVRRTFLRAVEDLGTMSAASWIARAATFAADIRPEAIARLGRLAEKLPMPAPEEALTLIHGVLGGFRTEELRDAVIAAGRIEDGEAIPYLLALLGEDDSGLRADAVWSLEKITGLHLRDRRDRWADWYESELAWVRDASEDAFDALGSRDDAVRIRALLEISTHHALRDRLSLRVIPLLEDSSAAVAKHAARTLRVLRSKVASVALMQAMTSDDPALVHEAWRALRAITRKDLPEDVAAWRAAFGP